MPRVRIYALILALPLIAFLCAEVGVRAGVLAWTCVYPVFVRPSTFPMYVVGESTAHGEPYMPKISFPRVVSRMLGDQVRGRPIELVDLSRPGSNVEEQYWRLYRELSLRPRRDGLVLIYAGINDGTGAYRPTPFSGLAERSLILSRVGYLVRSRTPRPSPLDFEERMALLLRLARARGLPVVISTLAGNVRDFSPQLMTPPQPGGERHRAYFEARRQENLGRWLRAAEAYEKLDRESRDAGLLHRAAVCRLKLGQRDLAARLFRTAVDLGGTKRPTTEQNDAIRRLARDHGAALADSSAALDAASPLGLAGDELFVDAHHPNLRGVALIARAFADQAARTLGVPVTRRELSEADLREEFGFTEEDERMVYSSRFLWFCGEAYVQTDKEDALRAARRYLDLAEKSYGRRLAPYRFLLALSSRDARETRSWLSRKDALTADPRLLSTLGCNPSWASELVRTAGLPAEAEASALGIMERAADLAQEYR